MSSPKKVLLDGRVFSTGAHDRGMGRYVAHVFDLLRAEGHDVTLLLFRDCHLSPDSDMLANAKVRFADYDAEHQDTTSAWRIAETRAFTNYLSEVIVAGGYDVFVDGTPFLRPCRYDVLVCPVVAICYDFIPLKHADDYLRGEGIQDFYFNGLARVAKADAIISISETVATEIRQYLGVPAERISVICPKLEERYLADSGDDGTDGAAPLDPYLFAIMGSHRSKNPQGAIRIFEHVLNEGELAVRINVPTAAQFTDLKRLGLPQGLTTTYDISESEKLRLQGRATVVAHLSIEEGFGIPLLEALFSGKKILALDIPMNREIVGRSDVARAGAVLMLEDTAGDFDEDDLHDLLAQSPDPQFYADIRAWYLAHWRDSAAIVSAALENAIACSRAWFENVAFKIVTSIPGASCGVADYSIAYSRSTKKNVLIFFAEGDEKNVEYLPNVRATSELDFEIVGRTHPHIPTLFNFAFSWPLFPSLRLLQSHGSERDALLIHEREYADAFKVMMSQAGLFEGFLARQAEGDDPDASARARALAFSAPFNKRRSEAPREVFPSDWLARLPVRLVHHLPPAVMEKMQDIQRMEPTAPINELQQIEDRLEFAPLGIDDRATPAVARAAKLARRRYGLQPDDLLVGHFGLVVPGIKRLPEIGRAVARAAAELRDEHATPRRIYFAMVGRVHDPAVEAEIRAAFEAVGLRGRLLQNNPLLEHDFEAELAACDLVACFRTQRRGQLSHVLVRAHALGRPVIVNRDSGYGYDPLTLVDDEDIDGGIARVLRAALDPDALAQMRARSRRRWETEHRGDRSLQAILRSAA